MHLAVLDVQQQHPSTPADSLPLVAAGELHVTMLHGQGVH